MSSNFTVVYDANVFFGAFPRNVMIHLAQAGIYFSQSHLRVGLLEGGVPKHNTPCHTIPA
jgi:hypothetical protein